MLRLDLFLKMSTLIKRRTVAKIACNYGKVLVNKKPCKASYEVKKNDIITILTKQPSIEVRVIDTSKKIGKQAAKEMFEII